MRYGQTKLANILFTKELARRLQPTRITVNALHPGAVSTSIGVAYLHPPATASADQLLADADAGLYAAKRAGRNQVTLHARVLDDESGEEGVIDC